MDYSANFSSSSSDSSPPTSPVKINAESSLFSGIPEDIEAIRRRVFSLKDGEVIQMSADDFNLRWPYIDHLFILHNERKAIKDEKVTRYYVCRLSSKKPYISKVQARERQRNRTTRNPIACPYRFKSVHKDG